MRRIHSWCGWALAQVRGPFALLAILFAFALSAPAFAADATLNDSARFLAGMRPTQGGALDALAKDRAFANHAAYFDKAWARLNTSQLSKVRAWSSENLKHSQPTVFYMFSGPDFLYANAFFPNAQTYVMAGLEAPGFIPDPATLPKSSVSSELASLRGSLNSVLSYSFFITKKMKKDLQGRHLTGTLPVLFVFLARSGKTIENVSFVTLDKDGTLSEIAPDQSEKAETPGVKITFSGDDKVQKTLYYFRTDLSNDGTGKSGFLNFCQTLGAADSFVKSASYLLHVEGFSRVRSFLLDHSFSIVQDDSGIPLRQFDKSGWDVEPFGHYVRPISLFQRNYQPDLQRFFASRKPQPLRFSFGYQWKAGQSMVLVAMKKADPSQVGNKSLMQPAKHDEESSR